MALQSKMTVYAAIAGMLALMGGIVYYASLDNPALEQVKIELHNVEIIDVNNIENKASLQVTFMVKNPSEKTFTVPSITYQLYGDERLIGSGQYSTEDIAMPGRAAFYPEAEIPLESKLVITKSEANAEIYEDVVNNRINNFSVQGTIAAETAWSIIEKEFDSST
ncbi:MAG: hypothetical protein R3327_05700 [Nitrosopumilaceae archaeon]|nr:hypothetical protein [Nitrosopumilaceae archaeon]